MLPERVSTLSDIGQDSRGRRFAKEEFPVRLIDSRTAGNDWHRPHADFNVWIPRY